MVTEAIERHELSALFTDMSESDYQDLVQSISAHGQREPIRIIDGKIIDGWHRYRAALDAGVQPWIEDYQEAEHGEIADFVIDQNIHRRHLSEGDRARIVVRVREWRAPGAKSADANDATRTNKQMADEAHVSVGTISRAKRELKAENEPPAPARPVVSEYDEEYEDEDDAPYTETPAAPAAEPPRLTNEQRLEAEIEIARRDVVALTQERDDLRERLGSYERAENDVTAEIDSLNDRLMAERSQREDLQTRLDEAHAQNQQQALLVTRLRELADLNDCEAIMRLLED